MLKDCFRSVAIGIAAMLASDLGIAHAQDNQLIIDMHGHVPYAYSSEGAERSVSIEEIKRQGFHYAVIGAATKEDVEALQDPSILVSVMLACPRNLAPPYYQCFPEDGGWVDIEWLENEVAAGRIGAIHEILTNYSGISPGNPRLEPYWALAERYDIPVGIHTQRGPTPQGGLASPRGDPNCCPNYDQAMGNPDLLRPVLDRHPDLRIWIQHVGAGPEGTDFAPFWDETLALLRDYPNVYLDVSITNSIMPLAQYEETLRRLIDAGFKDRIMFGSDAMPLQPIIERTNRIEWLSDEDKLAIFYGNAARFLRINPGQ